MTEGESELPAVSTTQSTPAPIESKPTAGSPESAPNQWRTFLLRETVLIALIPVVGYGIAYAFALGRALHLGLPDQLVSVTLSDVLRSIAAILGPIGVTYAIFMGLADFLPGNSLTHVRKSFLIPTVLFVGGIVFLRAAQAGWIWWAIVLGGIVFLFGILPVVVSMAAQKGVSGFGNRFKAAMSSESQATRPRPSSRFIVTVGPWNYLLVVGAFLILFLSWAAGQGSASNQSVYFRLQSTHDVLVAVDGDTLIFEGYSGHTLTGQLRLVSTGPDHQVSMTPVKVGPLGTPTICVYKEC